MTLEHKRLALSAGELAYADEGDGPAVVLLHGFPTSSHLWRDLVPILAPRFRAIAPDLMGYGRSSKPEDPSALTIRAQAGYVRELLDQTGIDEFAVIGHDLGGGVAQLLALEGGVGTMVLLDSISFDSWPIEAVRMLQAADPGDADEDFVRGAVGLALDLGLAHGDRLAEVDREAYLRPWMEAPAALIRAARAIDGLGLTGTEGRLGALDARVLLVWGEEDPYQPAERVERLADVLPGSTAALLPGCAHFVTEDAPEAVLPLIAEYLRVHHLRAEHHHHVGPTPVELGISFDRPAPGDPEA